MLSRFIHVTVLHSFLWLITFHWRREWQPTPVFLPGEFHGQRSLVVYSPRGHKQVRHDWATNTQYSIAWLYHVLFIHSSLDGHLDIVSTFLAIGNNAAMNICEQDFMSSYVFNSPGYAPRGGIAGSYANFMFNFWGAAKLFSRVAALILPSHQFLHIHTCYWQHLLLTIFLITAILVTRGISL